MNWTPTHWRKPRTGDALLFVRFRNGIESKQALPAAKWNWSDRDYNFDIIAARREV